MSVLTNRTKDLVRGSYPRYPCILLIDTSSAMQQDGRIAQLNAGLHTLKRTICDQAGASSRVDIAIVTFSDRVSLDMDWTLAIDFEPPMLQAAGKRAMCHAILEAIALAKHRKEVYKDRAIRYSRPWIFMISYGEPTDPELLGEAKAALRVVEQDSVKLTFCAIGLPGANMDFLRELSINPAFEMKRPAFDDVFQWIGISASREPETEAVRQLKRDGAITDITDVRPSRPPRALLVPPPAHVLDTLPSSLIQTSRQEKA